MKNFFLAVMIFSSLSYASPNFNSPIFANPDIKNANNWVKIKDGSFQMGTPTSEIGRRNDETLHDVTISHDFDMQSTVVTQAQYFLVMSSNPSAFKSRSFCLTDYEKINDVSLCPNLPVDAVTRSNVRDFIEILNSRDAVYLYRLPTEAEWEYSARAGSQTAYWYGNDIDHLGDYAWYDANSENSPHTVGSKLANPWGLYDMLGNTEQWTSDYYDSYSTFPQIDPEGPPAAISLNEFSIRGARWDDNAQAMRAGFRRSCGGRSSYSNLGFRLVRTHK